ncbi:hypothetical protein [Cytobacillus kochii]|uniref:hypothetical protein n=1 Tax=Cytobacillus kochii TaxID=859143 RepID=UPI00204208C7|nr:hypothetical protein [Cytobacillus kochii]MCM3324265.1 hypothetical protein [Cytobacillus kochii]MCM3346666.1 hypothetical protein [Cytobacillus kochii]MED1607780.1 hypothetical protein [Cytobacillus kochii]
MAKMQAFKNKDLMRKGYIEELHAMNITTSREGVPLEQLDYEALRYEKTIASFREIDSETSSNAWF